MAYGILVPLSRNREPGPRQKASNPNYWTARESLQKILTEQLLCARHCEPMNNSPACKRFPEALLPAF